MLEPGKRLLYLEELRPPEGYQLDRAIATTFSLDLLSLLLTPLSMVLYESQNSDQLLRDPLSTLEAIRRSAGRIAIFCQKGRMNVSKHQQLLYNFLENIVVEVQPPGKRGVFHPKVWLVRFKAENAPPIYRLMCLSRNLTFDRSWDTILVLEGELKNRKRAYGRNHPLGDFIKSLPALSASDVPKAILEHVDIMADEVRRVQFDVEMPFVDDGGMECLTFAPIGIEGYKRAPKLSQSRAMLVISPFLSEGWLKEEIKKSPNFTLVSRSESLNALSDKTYGLLEKAGAMLYVMDEASEPIEHSSSERTNENGTSEPDSTEPIEDFELSGLHAKMFITEKNSQSVRLWTGSANATTAAFKGQNIEFLIGLKGPAKNIGISKLLGENGDSEENNISAASSFLELLQPYKRPPSPQDEDATLKHLENALEDARKSICDAPLEVRASPDDKGSYVLEILAHQPWTLGNGVEAWCAPISLHKNDRKPVTPLAEGRKVDFRNLPIARLTCFISFMIKARLHSQEIATSFVLKLVSEGFPEDRERHVLSSIVSNSDRFLKYLLLLLSENDPLTEQKLLGIFNKEGKKPDQGGFSFGLPLFEELVRSFSRQPQSIDRIASLVEDLSAGESKTKIIPPEFSTLWETFLAARKLKEKYETKQKKT